MARLLAGALLVLLVVPEAAQAQTRSLKLYFTHTRESIDVVYKRGGRYVPSGLRELNRFLRDWRRNESTKMNPELFDLLWEVQQEFGGKTIHVVSAYRSPATNRMLRRRSRGVARKSQHMVGNAIDFFIKGVPISKVRVAGMKRQVGGVGYYPRSGSPFVHFDTGSVRAWPRMSRGQLARLFPDGKTLHLPSDGKPLKGYAAAKKLESEGKLASLRSGGGGFGFGLGGLLGGGGSRNNDGVRVASVQTERVVATRPSRDAARSSDDKPKPVETARVAPTRPAPPAPEPAPASSRDEADGDGNGGGLLRQLPSVSLGGMINRLRGNEAQSDDDAPEVVPVALPDDPLVAVALDSASDPDAASTETSEAPDAAPAPIPMAAPRDVVGALIAEADTDSAASDEAGVAVASLPTDEGGRGPDAVREAIARAAAATAQAEAGAPLAYGPSDGLAAGGRSPLDATTALIPRSALGPPPAPARSLRSAGSAALDKSVSEPAILTPVRGASPALIADAGAVASDGFSGFVSPDRREAGSLLLATGRLGAPAGFGASANWPTTDRFTGVRITVYADPRS